MQGKNHPKTDLIRRHLEYLHFYPNSVEANYNLGLAYLQAGQLEEALLQFQRALDLRPTLAEAYINMGGIFFRQGKLDECIQANQKALEISPSPSKPFPTCASPCSKKECGSKLWIMAGVPWKPTLNRPWCITIWPWLCTS
jgi:tetratricopeptide (TPR) repeat protein